jgi:hypothetical protein
MVQRVYIYSSGAQAAAGYYQEIKPMHRPPLWHIVTSLALWYLHTAISTNRTQLVSRCGDKRMKFKDQSFVHTPRYSLRYATNAHLPEILL